MFKAHVRVMLCVLSFSFFVSSKVFAACSGSNVVPISSVPATLDQAGKTYCLSQNITTGSGSFEIKASDVTLDGNGYTVSVSSGISSTHKYDRVTVQNMKLEEGGVTFVYQDGATDLKFIDNELGGFQIYEATQITIQGNTVHGGLAISGKSHCEQSNATVTCAIGMTLVPDIWSENDVVEDNTFIDSDLQDVRFVIFSNLKNMTFRNNHVEIKNSSGNIIQIHYSVDSTFEGNTVISDIDPGKSGETYGFHIRDGVSRSVFKNNYVRSTGSNCMLVGGSGNVMYLKGVTDSFTDPWGYENQFIGNQLVLSSSSLSESALRYDTSNGGDIFEDNFIFSESGQTASFRFGAIPPSSNPTIVKNNTVVSLSGGTALNFMEGSDQNGLMTLKNNIFYHGANGISAAGAIPTSSSDYNLYFPAASDFLAREAHSLGVDPLFVDIVSQDFELSKNPKSPAIGTGEGGIDMGASFQKLEDAVHVGGGGCSMPFEANPLMLGLIALLYHRRTRSKIFNVGTEG